MAVEIGTLVVKGAFGAPEADRAQSAALNEETLDLWRREILDAVQDMMDAAERRARER